MATATVTRAEVYELPNPELLTAELALGPALERYARLVDRHASLIELLGPKHPDLPRLPNPPAPPVLPARVKRQAVRVTIDDGRLLTVLAAYPIAKPALETAIRAAVAADNKRRAGRDRPNLVPGEVVAGV